MSIGAYIDCDLCSDTPTATGASGDFRRRLRGDVRALGWIRVRVGGRMLDVCGQCVRERLEAHRAREEAKDG